MRRQIVGRDYRFGDDAADDVGERHWLMRQTPGGGHQSVARLLQAAGVPARHRRQVLVVAEGARVLWVAGHRASADALATPGEAAVLLEAVAA